MKYFKKTVFFVGGFVEPLVFLLICGFASFLFNFSQASNEENYLDKIEINEIAWMGTKESYSNEWIELFNNSEEEIDLKDLTLENKSGDLEINLEGEVEAQDFFLLERTDDKSVSEVACDQIYTGSLSNDGEDLFLKDANTGEILDEAFFEEKGWPAGDNDSKRTMEKKSGNDWQTSADPGGTPGKKNSEGLQEQGEEKEEKEEFFCNPENNPRLLDVFINEIYPKPNPEFDKKENQIEWLEFFNSGQEEVSLQGCCLADENAFSSDDKTMDDYFCFSENAKIKSEKYLKVDQEEINFILNDGKEAVYFLGEDEVVLDKKEYTNSEKGYSYALNKEGKWKWTSELTPEEKNEFSKPAECPGNVVISEVFPNPKEDESENEWIEIYNPSNKKISLEGCYLADESLLDKKDVKKYFSFSKEDEVEAGGYLVVKRDRFDFGMNNGGETVSLRNSQNEEISGLKYNESGEGFSYALDKDNNWKWTEILTTGKDNQFPKPKKYSQKVRINEIMPNPEGKDKGKEWIEFLNLDDKKIDLAGWSIENQSGGSFEIEKLILEPKEVKSLRLKETSFSIRNSGGWMALKDPGGGRVDKVEYPDSSPVEASWSRNKSGSWSWSHFTTPDQENKLNHPPEFEIKKPAKIYKDIRAYFKTRNLVDADGDELKFRWEFGDGHRSYKKETSHIYEEEGDYLVRVRASDPSAEVFKEFELDVKEYPDYEVTITKLLPNPSGRDSEEEKIWIENKSEEDINLRGWSVATGKNEEELTNHPIREDFEIEAGETRVLQRSHCAFSLLNKKAVIVLRYPDEDKAYQVEYEKDAIKNDEMYALDIQSGEWGWILTAKKVSDNQKETNPERKINRKNNKKEKSDKYRKDLISILISNKKIAQSQNISKLVVENWRFHTFSGRIWQRNDLIEFDGNY